MNNISDIIQRYQKDGDIQSLIEKFENENTSKVKLDGITGSVDAFIIAAIANETKKSQIFIANDKEEAAYMTNTLDSILPKKKIQLFVDSFKRPLFFEELDKTNALQRTEIVNNVSMKDGLNSIVITYPEALFEKVVNPLVIAENQIEILKGNTFDIDFTIEVLVQYGFERVEFVYQPGQFSIRGGIFDIFSYGNEWPYRIELFDDEVESIRTFDPTTQLSVHEISKVSIIPNITNKFDANDKINFFDIFNADSIVWIRDKDHMIDMLQQCFEHVDRYLKKLSLIEDEDLKNLLQERAFVYPHDVIERVENLNVIYLNPRFQGEFSISLNLDVKPQPVFNKSFEHLIQSLKENTKNDLVNYIFTDNAKQIERFYNIFQDMNAQVLYFPQLHSLHAGFIDAQRGIACYTDHQIFERFHRYKLRRGFTQDMALSLKMVRELKPGDFVTHIDHGIGRYSGLETIIINGHKQESVRLVYQNNDILYVSINSLHKISRFVGKDGTEPKLSKIGGDAWKNLKRKTKSKIKDIAMELIKLYAVRKASKGFEFPPDNYMQAELEASFIYEDTPDQLLSTIAVKEDMEKPYPMDRLVCGDVGFGKTEIAIRAAFKAVVAGKQVAILVPTTILALQHFKTFSERLKEFGVTVDYVNRFKSTKEKNEVYAKTEDGKIEILIGTHAILNKKIKFKDLGLLIIDEEQKFGVAAKEKLRKMQVNVDTLTLTATPIPRTLQFSLMAARDLSIIHTPPPNRQPIHTERRVFSEELIKDAIYNEVHRGGQVFFVHNRVKTLYEVADMVKKICPDVTVQVAHGQMDSEALENTLLDFIDRQFDVLVSTNIIETGLDIPNANTMIINNSHHFGLSDLHQLRGRVGRSNKRAFCYLFAPPLSVMTSEARLRIQTLEEFSDLGSGFQIAMKDLDIRGAGNLLGAEQSGFISDIGYETYQKILEEAIDELKENEYKELFKEENARKVNFVRETEIDTDIEMLIPDTYVTNIQERLSLYTDMDNLNTEEELIKLIENMKDRFGPIPSQVIELANGIRMRWMAKKLGFERLILKNGKMNCYFISMPQSSYFETTTFHKVMAFVSDQGRLMQLSVKQSQNNLILSKMEIKSLKQGLEFLEKLFDFASKKETTEN